MNRIRLLAIGATLMIALTTFAQQTPTGADDQAKSASGGEHASVPTAEAQLKFLAANLSLTSNQQDMIKPILRELHESTVKLVQDENMPHEERLSKIRNSRYAADKKIRTLLNDDQKKKLDQLEEEPHPELHGAISGVKN
jgi:hypothetical protein